MVNLVSRNLQAFKINLKLLQKSRIETSQTPSILIKMNYLRRKMTIDQFPIIVLRLNRWFFD